MAEERAFRLEQLRRLTGRELEVLQWRASGRTIPELAADLNVTERTAHFHLGNIYAKLDLASRSQGQRQIELAAYGRLLAESGVGATASLRPRPTMTASTSPLEGRSWRCSKTKLCGGSNEQEQERG